MVYISLAEAITAIWISMQTQIWDEESGLQFIPKKYVHFFFPSIIMRIIHLKNDCEHLEIFSSL